MKRPWKIIRRLGKFGDEDKSRISLLGDALYDPPRICIGLETLKTIFSFVRVARGEVNGMGIVEKIGNDFLISDVFILDQDASAAHAEIDPMALNRLVAERADYDKLRFQWHSHVNMPAKFSGVDTATIANYAGYFGDFMISFVGNKRGEYSCRLDLFKPFYVGFEVPLTILVMLEPHLLEVCRAEVGNKVRGDSFLADLISLHKAPTEEAASNSLVAVSLGDLDFEREKE
jgi:hypothetical protein